MCELIFWINVLAGRATYLGSTLVRVCIFHRAKIFFSAAFCFGKCVFWEDEGKQWEGKYYLRVPLAALAKGSQIIYFLTEINYLAG